MCGSQVPRGDRARETVPIVGRHCVANGSCMDHRDKLRASRVASGDIHTHGDISFQQSLCGQGGRTGAALVKLVGCR